MSWDELEIAQEAIMALHGSLNTEPSDIESAEDIAQAVDLLRTSVPNTVIGNTFLIRRHDEEIGVYIKVGTIAATN